MTSGNYLVLALTIVNLVLLASQTLGNDVSAATQIVRAERFELVDSRGTVRAKLMVRDDDFAGLSLFNAKGEHRASLQAGADGATLLLEALDGKHRAMLTTAPGPRRTYLHLVDGHGFVSFDPEQTIRKENR